MDNDFNDVKEKKSKTGLIVFLVLIAGLAIGGGATYYYFEIMNKEEVKVEEEKTEEVEEMSLNIAETVLLMDQYQVVYHEDLNPIDYLFTGTEENMVSSWDEHTKLMLTTNQFPFGTKTISADEFESMYIKLFGPQENFVHKTITWNKSTPGDYYIYDDATKTYTYNEELAVGGTTNISHIKKMISLKEEDNQIIAQIAAGYTEASTEEGSMPKVFNYDKAEITEFVKGEYFDIDYDYSSLSLYDLYFTYDKDTDNYYLEKVVKAN